MSKSKASSGIVPEYIIGDPGKETVWMGLNTAVKDNRFLKRGETYDALNWMTGRDQDHIELRLGQKVLGTTVRNVSGQSVTGLGVAITNAGLTQVPFFTFGRKIMYYDGTDTHEVSTVNILPAEANGEDVSMQGYQNLAGSFMYVTSPHSSIYKIAASSPQSVSDQGNDETLGENQYGEVQDYKFGFIKINQSRMFGMDRYGRIQSSQDQTGLYLSHVDRQSVDDFDNRMPDDVPTPVVTQSTTGGTIAPGTYYFVMTMFGPQGTETMQGFEITVIVPSGTSTNRIIFTFPNVAGATQYNLYGSTTNNLFVSPSFAATIYAVAPGFGNNVINLLNTTFTTGQPPSSTTQEEVGNFATGDGTTKTFTGTLSSYVNPLTPFFLQMTDGVEYFQDNKNGILVGSLGGTGTINYITGVVSVTFNTAPANGARITTAFYLEDATRGGVLDFVPNPIDTTNSSGQVFRQDDGGGIAQAVFPFNGVEYAFHVLRSWSFQINSDSAGDTFQNKPYFEQLGIPYPRAAFPTGEGLMFLNISKKAQPQVSILTIPPGSTNLTVVPISLSDQLDLSSFGFVSCVIFRFGELDIMACRMPVNGLPNSFNNIVFARNIVSGKWDLLDYSFNCLAEYNGTLIAGDALSVNLLQLFSGFDDNGSVISNYYKTSYQNLELDGLKKVGYIHMEGLIQTSQKLQVWYSLDNGEYVYLFTINGDGSYVSTTDLVTIGSQIVGSTVVGGGTGTSNGGTIQAGRYEIDIPIHTDRFEYISLMFVAIDVGYVSVERAGYKDIRWKTRRVLPYYDLEINQ